MSLYDFFFPEQAQATHLRRIAEQQGFAVARNRRASVNLEARVRALENDLGYVTSVLGSVLDNLDAKGVVTRQDLKEAMAVLDAIDGVQDGKLDINVLRGKQD
jgi:hypothetical protein